MLTKIISSSYISQIKKWAGWAERYVIICHTSPDGDAIGSSLGFWHFLLSMGKQARVIAPNAYPDFLSWMPGASEIVNAAKQPQEAQRLIQEADVICCIDFNALNRIEELGEAVKNSVARKILIDHHPFPEDFADITISHPEMSSSCELVFRLICQLGYYPKMTKEAAECICAGMMTDTGNFSYNANNKDVYFILSELISKGVDKDEIYRRLYYNYSAGRLRLMGFVLYEKMILFPKYHAALITLTKQEMERFQYVKGDSEGFVNMPLQIKGILFTAFLREDTEKEGKINVSLRSTGTFPCNQVASQFFHGGGHLNASGGELYGVTLDEVVKLFKEALEKFKPQLTAVN